MADGAVVLGTADEDAGGFVVVATEHLVDEDDVEVEFPTVLGAGTRPILSSVTT